MQFDSLAHDCQTEAGALPRCRAFLEGLQQRASLSGESRTIILDQNRSGWTDLDVHLSARRGVTYGILYEISQCFPNGAGITRKAGGLAQAQHESVLGLCGPIMKSIDDFTRDQTNVDIVNDKRFGAFKTGQRQQAVDSRTHCSYVLLDLTRARIFDAPELQRNYGQGVRSSWAALAMNSRLALTRAPTRSSNPLMALARLAASRGIC